MKNSITYKGLAEQNVKLTSEHLENIYAGMPQWLISVFNFMGKSSNIPQPP